MKSQRRSDGSKHLKVRAGVTPFIDFRQMPLKHLLWSAFLVVGIQQ